MAQHLVMVAAQLEADDLDAALAHAETAVRRAGRVPAAREALGMVAYRRGDFARALTEFRTARRLSGSSTSCPSWSTASAASAVPLARSTWRPRRRRRRLAEEERLELAIVVSGVRRDLGQNDAALLALQIPALRRGPRAGLHRLHYAYADILLDLGREDEAREWFLMAATEDTEQETDAVERLEDLDGIVVMDLGGEEEDDRPGGAGHPPEPTE